MAAAPLTAATVLVIAFVGFAVVSVVLAVIDVARHRLPNAIVLPSYAVTVALFTLACVLGAEWQALVRAGVGMVVLFVFYFLLRLISPSGMGGGDVKLAGVIGLFLGWVGWSAVIVGVLAAFVLGGMFGAILLLIRRASRRTAIPFGPWMLIGAWIGILTHEFFAEAIGVSFRVP